MELYCTDELSHRIDSPQCIPSVVWRRSMKSRTLCNRWSCCARWAQRRREVHHHETAATVLCPTGWLRSLWWTRCQRLRWTFPEEEGGGRGPTAHAVWPNDQAEHRFGDGRWHRPIADTGTSQAAAFSVPIHEDGSSTKAACVPIVNFLCLAKERRAIHGTPSSWWCEKCGPEPIYNAIRPLKSEGKIGIKKAREYSVSLWGCPCVKKCQWYKESQSMDNSQIVSVCYTLCTHVLSIVGNGSGACFALHSISKSYFFCCFLVTFWAGAPRKCLFPVAALCDTNPQNEKVPKQAVRFSRWQVGWWLNALG